MKTEVFGTALIAIIAGLYLGLVKISMIIAVSLIIIGYSGKTKKTKTKTSSQDKTEETVLHPVIYEDAGEPPNLYPEDGSIKIYPDGKEKKLTAGGMVSSIGNAAKITTKGVKKLLD